MKEAIVQPSIEAIEIIDSPIPVPKDKEVVIKVIVAGTNPKDWKYPLWKNWAHNPGDDMAGIVHSIGENVCEFSPGDRVAAFHQTGTEHGTFAEYSVAPDWTTFHIPDDVSFEEAATIPIAALTAAIALYQDMALPPPYKPVVGEEKVPLLIYGVTTSVGAFAAKLARLSGLRPVIGIAGRAGDYARSVCDHVVDYRQGEDAMVAGIEQILKDEGLGTKVSNVFDTVSEGGSLEVVLRFLNPHNGTVSTVLPTNLFAKDPENFKWPTDVKAYNSAVPLVHSTEKDFGFLWSRYLGRLLEDGRLKAHPYEVVPGGLNGIPTALQNLRDGKASAMKYVCRIEETDNTASSVQGAEEPSKGDSASKKSTDALRNFPFPK